MKGTEIRACRSSAGNGILKWSAVIDQWSDICITHPRSCHPETGLRTGREDLSLTIFTAVVLRHIPAMASLVRGAVTTKE